MTVYSTSILAIYWESILGEYLNIHKLSYYYLHVIYITSLKLVFTVLNSFESFIKYLCDISNYYC